jgi:hypothetical protein
VGARDRVAVERQECLQTLLDRLLRLKTTRIIGAMGADNYARVEEIAVGLG